MNFSSKTKVAVLRGGPSDGYSSSLKTGAKVLSILREMPEHYEPIDIFISKDGWWHREGLIYRPSHALRHADVVWNALHGPYGEDGQVQKILEGLKIPYTGSSAFASALSMDKHFSKDVYKKHSLPTPAHELITEDNLSDDRLIEIFRNYLHPVIVRPANSNRSYSKDLIHSFDDLSRSVRDTLRSFPRVMVEEYVKGDEISCVVIDEAKGERLYALLPESESGLKLQAEENRQIENLARRAHQALGLRHYSGSNFVVTPKKKIYILETNSVPEFHDQSPAHTSLSATGWKPRDFVVHILNQLA